MHMRTTAAGMGVLIVGALLLMITLGGASESREIRNTWEAAVNKADLIVAIVGYAHRWPTASPLS
jgi:hypothetical protein